MMPNHLRNQPSFAHKLWRLKEELELTELNEQIYRMRKRLALSKFFDTYTTAQAHARSLRDENVATKQARKGRRRNRDSRADPVAPKARVATSVQNRFVDLLFSETITTCTSLTTVVVVVLQI